MVHRVFARAAAAVAAGWIAGAASPATAQSPADFYKGKTVDLYVGYSVGGGYDLYARVLARHIGAHIPGNPTVIVKNMEGAGSLRLANWLYRVAPKDGSVIGIIGRGTGFDPLLSQQGAQFDGPKFTWIGSGNHEVSVCVAYGDRAGVTKFADLTAPLPSARARAPGRSTCGTGSGPATPWPRRGIRRANRRRPGREDLVPGPAVEGVIHLDGLEPPGVGVEPLQARGRFRVEDAHPVVVAPARGPDVGGHDSALGRLLRADGSRVLVKSRLALYCSGSPTPKQDPFVPKRSSGR